MDKDILIKSLKGSHILVTGSEGFIGSQLVHRLVECGANVIASASRIGWRPWFTELVRTGKISLIESDVLTQEGVAKLTPYLSSIDAVIHMARIWAQGSTMLELAIDEIEGNLLGTIRFLSSASQYVSTIVYPSSIEVYGIPQQLPVNEDHPSCPVSPYGVTKLAIEGFLRSYSNIGESSIIILRYATVYGPGELVPRAVPNFIRAALQGNPPVIDGDGEDVRDYVFVSDVVNVTLRALVNSQKGVHIYNVGSGIGYATNELTDLIIRLTGSNVKPLHRHSARSPIKLVCDINKIRQEIGYSPKFSLKEGLLQEIRWFRENPSTWQKK